MASRKELHGPRPTKVVVNNSSSKIKKPIMSRSRSRSQTRSLPVVVYLIAPEIIHVDPHEFMNLVQRLTGNQRSSAPCSGSSYSSSSLLSSCAME